MLEFQVFLALIATDQDARCMNMYCGNAPYAHMYRCTFLHTCVYNTMPDRESTLISIHVSSAQTYAIVIVPCPIKGVVLI